MTLNKIDEIFRKRLLAFIIGVCFFGSAFSQTYNSTKSWVARKPISLESDIMDPVRSIQEVAVTTEFVDGFSRTVQTVGKQSSPAMLDVVSMHVFDGWSREVRKYLPFVSGSDGSFKNNAEAIQASFNQGLYPGESHFYSQIDLENSPGSRVLKQYGQGINRVGSSRGVSIRSVVNTSNDNVRIWTIGMAPGSLPISTSAYAAGELYKTISIDEEGRQSIQYTDKGKQVILKKIQQSVSGVDDGSGSGHSGWICTYYVYDDYGNLRFIISPQLVSLIDGSWNVSQANADALCYRYECDDYGRRVIQKKPGAPAGNEGEIWTVFDQRGRAVLEQDGNLRHQQKWQYFQYDSQDRVISVGILSDPVNYNNRVFHQNNALSSVVYPNLSEYAVEVINQTWYDNYNWVVGSGSGLDATLDASNNGNTSIFYPASNTTAPYYPQEIVQSKMTHGLPTGSKTEVLGSNGSNYLFAVSFYDDWGRLIQTQGRNLTGGTDEVTTQYSWDGKPIRMYRQHQFSGQTTQTHNLLTKMEYDHGNRVTATTIQINSVVGGVAVNSGDKTIASYSYNDIGQVRTKTLGSSLESQTYDYGIKGEVVGINRNYTISGNTGNWFGFELGYDKAAAVTGTTGFSHPVYDGNISGIVWRTRGDGVSRKYDFQYDRAKQLVSAGFTQNTEGTTWDNSYMDFSLNGKTYDLNGNVKTLAQNGFVLGGSPQIDQLSYRYESGDNSNTLQNVIDNANDPDSKLGDFHYATSNKTPEASVDYTYDYNGSLKSDANKGISSITYNILDLPYVITTAKGTITFLYDGLGNKLRKTTVENGASVVFNDISYSTDISTVTTYFGGFVYQSKTYSNSALSSLNQSESLSFVTHDEGRARLKEQGSEYSWVFDYFVRDHLGNIRMTLTDEAQTDFYPAATLEDAGMGLEQTIYNISNDAGHVIEMNGLGWYSGVGGSEYTNNSNNGLSAPPDQTVNPTQLSTKMYKLNGATGDRFGLGVSLKVMAGDAVQVYGRSLWHNPGGSVDNSSYLLSSIASSFINAFAGTNTVVAGSKGVATGPLLNSNLPTTGNLGNILNNSPVSGAAPRGNLCWVLFDEQFKPVTSGSGFDPISQNADEFKPHSIQVSIPKSGYLYIYCSNESDWDVYFDNFQVVHSRGALLNEMHYYPDGLSMFALTSRAAGKLQTNFGFQGKDLQSAEFHDGSGLEWYDFDARYYDPQIARWHVQDPVLNFSTPYSGMFNNPTAHIDPDGRDPLTIAIISGIILGGYGGYKVGEAKGASGWSMVGYILGGAAIGGLSGYVGGIAAANGGFMSHTMAIAMGSGINSMGMTFLSDGMLAPSISFGVASFDLGTGDWGYLGKKGNSFWANLGYTFGALANISDIVAGKHGTDIKVKARPKLSGHSEIEGEYISGYDPKTKLPITEPITVSVAPKDMTIGGARNGLKWEGPYVKRTLQGNSVEGVNHALIGSGSKQVVTSLTNVNGKLLSTMTRNLNASQNLLSSGSLKYGLLFGCVNYTSRALLFSGVININAFLPITAPLLLNAEMALRQVGIMAAPYLINY